MEPPWNRWAAPEDGLISGLLDGVDGWGLGGRLAHINHAWNISIGAWRASIGTLQLSQLNNHTAAAISRFCTNLRRFEIKQSQLSPYECLCSDSAMVSVLNSCPLLQALDLADSGSSPAVLTAIAASCPQLLSLSLYCLDAAADFRVYVTAPLMANLCRGCPQLEALELHDCFDLDDESVISIARFCPQIQRIVHIADNEQDRNTVSDAALAALGAGCRQLREFSLIGMDTGSSISDTGVAALARGCPLLHTLSIGGSRVTSEGIASLTTYCPLLRALDVSWCDAISDAAIIALAQPGSRLADLNLAFTGDPYRPTGSNACAPLLTDIALDALCRCSQLQTLTLNSNRAVTISGVARILRACPQMTEVQLYGASGMTQAEVNALRTEFPAVSLPRYGDGESDNNLYAIGHPYGHRNDRDQWVSNFAH